MTNEIRSALSMVADEQRKRAEQEQEDTRPSLVEIYEEAKKQPDYLEHYVGMISATFEFDNDTHELIIYGENKKELARIDIDDVFTEYMENKEKEDAIIIQASLEQLAKNHPSFEYLLLNFIANVHEDTAYLAGTISYDGSHTVYILANSDEIRLLSEFAETMKPFTERIPNHIVYDRIEYIFPSLSSPYYIGVNLFERPFIGSKLEQPYGYTFTIWTQFEPIGMDEITFLDNKMVEIEKDLEYRHGMIESNTMIMSFNTFLDKLKESAKHMESLINHMSFWDKKSAGQSYKYMKWFIRAYKNTFTND